MARWMSAFATTIVIVFLVMRIFIFATVIFVCLWSFFVATRFFSLCVRFATSVSQRWCQKETKHHYQHYGNLSCHILSVCKGINFFVRVCWKKNKKHRLVNVSRARCPLIIRSMFWSLFKMVCSCVNVQILVVRLMLALSSVTLAGNGLRLCLYFVFY